jgi:predicted Zn finger-like uncharacterized protein
MDREACAFNRTTVNHYTRGGDKALDRVVIVATTTIIGGANAGWQRVRGNEMRLVCPNCDARYEVPDGAIPEGGREVQCSSCGHAWFQLRPEVEAAAEEEAALFGDDLAAEVPVPTVPAPDAPPPAIADSTTDAIAALLADAEPDQPAAAAPPKRELDDSVKAVLREEAEREAEARRLEAQRDSSRRADAEGQMQVQAELGVDMAAPVALSPTQRRLAMLRGKDPDAPPPEPPRPTARRDLLPDVEEINSTLQPADSSIDPDAEVDALPDLTRRGSGFRSGFFLMILLLVVAAAVYIAAPKIAAQFPALADPLASYVALVDSLRIWLNDLVNRAANSLSGKA